MVRDPDDQDEDDIDVDDEDLDGDSEDCPDCGEPYDMCTCFDGD